MTYPSYQTDGADDVIEASRRTPRLVEALVQYYEQLHDELVLMGEEFDEEDEQDEASEMPAEDRDALRMQAKSLAGALWVGCEMLIDQLFTDLRLAETTGDRPDNAIGELPQRFAAHYTPEFIRRFLTVTVDLGHQLASGGLAPNDTPTLHMELGHDGKVSCVAQELALSLVVTRVRMLEDMYDLDLGEDWFEVIVDLLFYDLDFELLYDPAIDGFEEIPEFVPGISDMRLNHWFTPFNDGAVVNPYAAEGYPQSAGDRIREAAQQGSFPGAGIEPVEVLTTPWLIHREDVEALHGIDSLAFASAMVEFCRNRPFLTGNDVVHATLRKFGVRSKAPQGPDPYRHPGPQWALFELDTGDPADSEEISF